MNIEKKKQILLDSLRIPVIGAPLFIVSKPKLVIEQCKAGIIGSFPALNARTEEDLEKWMIEINEELENYKKMNLTKRLHLMQSIKLSIRAIRVYDMMLKCVLNIKLP